MLVHDFHQPINIWPPWKDQPPSTEATSSASKPAHFSRIRILSSPAAGRAPASRGGRPALDRACPPPGHIQGTGRSARDRRQAGHRAGGGVVRGADEGFPGRLWHGLASPLTRAGGAASMTRTNREQWRAPCLAVARASKQLRSARSAISASTASSMHTAPPVAIIASWIFRRCASATALSCH
jgi:hypothetical protein